MPEEINIKHECSQCVINLHVPGTVVIKVKCIYYTREGGIRGRAKQNSSRSFEWLPSELRGRSWRCVAWYLDAWYRDCGSTL